MLRFVFTRFILPLLLFFLLRYVLKTVGASMRSAVTPADPRSKVPPARAGGELMKDPVCGTYVSAASAVKREVGGETLHFCSTACRDKYRS
jgi:uncharacterized protein